MALFDRIEASKGLNTAPSKRAVEKITMAIHSDGRAQVKG